VRGVALMFCYVPANMIALGSGIGRITAKAIGTFFLADRPSACSVAKPSRAPTILALYHFPSAMRT
jgi:hypothetical protein